MENIILQKKLVFFYHLSNLPVESLAGEFFQLQIEKKIDGIVTECKEHIMRMGNPNPKDVSKYTWRKRTRIYVTEKTKKNYWMILKGIKS